MTTINEVPEPLSFREKASAIWSILRNRRWANRQQGLKTLHTFTDHVAEAHFRGGYTFRFQWYGKPEYATALALVNKSRALIDDAEPEELDAVTLENLVAARLIRRRDFAVIQIAGKKVPDAFAL